MKKTFFFACILSLSAAFNANANLRNTLDEFGRPITASSPESEMCLQLCPGYSSAITECPEGFDLVTCEVSSCANYNKCEQNPCQQGYDRSFKDCPIVAQPDNYHCTKCK